MTESSQKSANKIALMERKLAREKKARELAERQLEKYSREIYLTNKSLKTSLEQSRKKQSELEYLSLASTATSSELPISELITNTVELTGKFFSAELGFYFYANNGVFENPSNHNVWINNEWTTDSSLTEGVLNYLPIDELQQVSRWSVISLDDNSSARLDDYKWMVFVNFKLSKGRVAWLSFISNADYLDEEALFVLDTARSHVLNGIRRRISDVKVRRRNIQLQETVDELEKARRQLIQSEKMASLGQLAAGVAHEINNPIGFIRSNTEVLQEYVEEYNSFFNAVQQHIEQHGAIELATIEKFKHKADLSYIEQDTKALINSNLEGIDRIQDIIESLKTFSHAGEDTLVTINIKKVIENALKVTENALKYQHQVVNKIQQNLPTIEGNAGQLQQVFVNFIINAAQAMEKGGTLKLLSSFDSDYLHVSIQDTGCGMDEETMKNLFTPFFTTKAVGVGTGLGLSVSYAILETHHATVNVESFVGEGTSFTLSFPLIVN